ncbi:DDE-type integrase/transposase/recombinase [Zunongwangia sp. F260]|uniref:DDE-type integrase/transposase/recombinase n=1 Tax=Autumnicola lenta TaxID=3075593 RepID=A0ABU3CHI0_9FLAO|nr:DDE-type integrase/transposase/recombinase [Zunongwangia sp. F260]MDT0645809.1 DDE-type integrase/transposase/recombinase [Zunongwangia sp. F260]
MPKFEGRSYYLFVAIDRATRMMFYKVYENKKAESTEDFMDKCLDFFPVYIAHILTDNVLEFTTGSLCPKKENFVTSLLKCMENNIDHRLTKPATP